MPGHLGEASECIYDVCVWLCVCVCVCAWVKGGGRGLTDDFDVG